MPVYKQTYYDHHDSLPLRVEVRTTSRGERGWGIVTADDGHLYGDVVYASGVSACKIASNLERGIIRAHLAKLDREDDRAL